MLDVGTARELRPIGNLTYVQPDDPLPIRAAMRLMERASGSHKIQKLYRRWRVEKYARGAPFWESALDTLGMSLRLHGATWPAKLSADEPRIIIANHPYGVTDGVAAAVLAERLGRPFKILVNDALLKVPEPEPYLLPVDFNETRAALRKNLESRKRALAAMADGETIVIFPAGGVSTAPKVVGQARELPWKRFTARLIKEAEATVLPVYFPGQHGLVFHAVSRLSMRLRVSLMVGSVRKHVNRPLDICIGEPIRFNQLADVIDDRDATIDYLRDHVQGLVSHLPRYLRSNDR